MTKSIANVKVTRSAQLSNLKGGLAGNAQSLKDLKHPAVELHDAPFAKMVLNRVLFNERGYKKEDFRKFVNDSLLCTCYGIESERFRLAEGEYPWLCIPMQIPSKDEEGNDIMVNVPQAEQAKRNFAFQALMGRVNLTDENVKSLIKACYEPANEEFQVSDDLVVELGWEADTQTWNGIEEMPHEAFEYDADTGNIGAIWLTLLRSGSQTKNNGGQEVEEEYLLSDALLNALCNTSARNLTIKQRHEISVLGFRDQSGQVAEDYKAPAKLALIAALFREHLMQQYGLIVRKKVDEDGNATDKDITIVEFEDLYDRRDGSRGLTFISNEVFRCTTHQLTRHWMRGVQRLSSRQLGLKDEDWDVQICPKAVDDGMYNAVKDTIELIYSTVKLDNATQTAIDLSIDGMSNKQIAAVLYAKDGVTEQMRVSRLIRNGYQKMYDAANLLDIDHRKMSRSPKVLKEQQEEWKSKREWYKLFKKAQRQAEKEGVPFVWKDNSTAEQKAEIKWMHEVIAQMREYFRVHRFPATDADKAFTEASMKDKADKDEQRANSPKLTKAYFEGIYEGLLQQTWDWMMSPWIGEEEFGANHFDPANLGYNLENVQENTHGVSYRSMKQERMDNYITSAPHTRPINAHMYS